jgi:hypothetical protein
MTEFNVSLLANISFPKLIDDSLLSSTFKTRLVLEGDYSDERILVTLNPILGSNAKNQQGYKENEFLYSLVVTGSATSKSALQLGKFLYKTLNDFTDNYASGYFLYSMSIESYNKKDFCSQSNRER